MTNQSITSVFGLLFGSQFHNMQSHNTFTLALIGNLNSLALNFSGLFIGPIIKSYRPRNVATTGCILVSSGLLVCCFATEPWHFIIGYSICVGFGLGLISPSTFMIINEYFTTNRGRAVGISLAGSGVGQIILPHLARWCLEFYGFRAAFMTMSCISLTGIFGAFLLKPLNSQIPKHNNSQHIKPLLNTSDLKRKSTDSAMQQEEKPITCMQRWCQQPCQRLVQAMDLELLTNPIFITIIVGMALVYTSTVNFTMLFPHYLEHAAGLSKSYVASCMSIVAGADIISRFLLPCITDRLRLPYRVIFLIGSFGLLITRSTLAESKSLTSIVVMSVLIGISKSATVVNNNLVISAYCRKSKLAGGLGLNMIAKGVIVILLGLLLGWIRDITQSYEYGLHAQNILLLLVVCMWTPELCFAYYKHKKAQHKEERNDQTV